MKTAWIIVNKRDGKPHVTRHDFGKVTTVFLSRKGARLFVDAGNRVQRVRVTIY